MTTVDKSKQVTWGGRFNESPASIMVRFSESVSFDHRLAPFDIIGSKAYASMLCHVGLITKEECQAIYEGLEAILKEIKANQFSWKMELEDVHMNIEQSLTKRTPAAAKLHTGRSRNDQVITDMRLFFKDACKSIRGELKHLMGSFVEFASHHIETYLPGYTHLQRAQPVSMAHHLLAYVEMFFRDSERFDTVAMHANYCPLGSGAIAGSTLPIDREFLAKELGFVDKKGQPQLTENSMDAVSDRDLFVEFACACALCGTHVSRIAEDFILWSSAEFNFISLPDAFCTGSSLMPQKKNPDALELLRGKSGRFQGNLQMLLSLIKGTPMTYNRDFQEDKRPVFDSCDQILICLEVLSAVIPGITVNKEKCFQAASDPCLLATDLADYLVQKGIAFREAHHVVGLLVAKSEAAKIPLNELPYAQVQAIHPKIEKDWQTVFDLKRSFSRREKKGMPGPKQTKSQIESWQKRLCLS